MIQAKQHAMAAPRNGGSGFRFLRAIFILEQVERLSFDPGFLHGIAQEDGGASRHLGEYHFAEIRRYNNSC